MPVILTLLAIEFIKKLRNIKWGGKEKSAQESSIQEVE